MEYFGCKTYPKNPFLDQEERLHFHFVSVLTIQFWVALMNFKSPEYIKR